jgi:hypothetical protein
MPAKPGPNINSKFNFPFFIGGSFLSEWPYSPI